MDSGEDIHPKTTSRFGAKTITMIAAFALAAVMLYFSLRGIEWGQVGRLLRGAKPLNVDMVGFYRQRAAKANA